MAREQRIRGSPRQARPTSPGSRPIRLTSRRRSTGTKPECTTSVAPGTAIAADLELPVSGPIKLVDHTLTRAVRRGALGSIDVAGETDPEIFDDGPADA